MRTSLDTVVIAVSNITPRYRALTIYYLSKWVLIVFAVVPLLEKSKKPSGATDKYIQKERWCIKMSGSSSWRCVIGKAASAIALAIAKASVNSTCFFTAYQPEIPKSSEYK